MNAARIFISYSSKDVRRAARLHAALESAGHTVWRDKTRLETDWSREIALALAGSDVLCLVWSKNAAASGWVRHERLTARALRKPIVILKLPGAPPLPEPITTLQAQSAEGGLLKQLAALPLAAYRYDYTFLPPRSFLPFTPNPEFSGRGADLVDLYLAMIGNLKKVGLNQAGLHGMGGVGKTQLAVEFAYRFSHAFDSVHWVDGTEAGRLNRQFVDLARHRLQLRVAGSESDVDYLHRLQDHLRANPTTLIIVDNVEDPRVLNDSTVFPDPSLTILTLGANLLFTTRRAFRLPGVLSQNVNVLAEEDAYELLVSHRTPSSTDERRAALAIANTVGYLPLALVLIGGYLRCFSNVTYAEYLRLLREKKLESIDTGVVSDHELATRHLAAVGATLESQWKALSSRDARLLLRLAACLAESAIVPKARLGLLAGVAENRGVNRPLDAAFLELQDLNLAERAGADGTSVRLHPLVREFAHRLGTSAQRRKLMVDAAARVKQHYSDPHALRSHWIALGWEQIDDDLRTADSFAGNTVLTALRRALDREATALNLVQQDAPRFFQQLHHRTVLMGLARPAEAFRKAMAAFRAPWLRATGCHPIEDPALLHWRMSHQHMVRGAVFLDSRRAATTSWDGRLKIWDVESGELLHELKGHDKVINTLDGNADGLIAVTGSDDCSVIVWDLQSMEPRKTLTAHADYVTLVRISGDGKSVLSMSRDGLLILWDATAGTELLRKRVPQATVAALNRRGDSILIGHTDGKIELLTRNGTVADAFQTGRWVKSAAFLGDDLMATGGHDGQIHLWPSGRTLQLGDSVLAIAPSPAGDAIYAGCGREIMVCDLTTGKTRRTLRGHVEPVSYVAISPDERLAVSATGDERRLAAWDLGTRGHVSHKPAHSNSISSLSFSLDGRRCASASYDKQVLVWDRNTIRIKQRIPIGRVVSSSLSWQRRLLLSKEGGQAQLWDLRKGAELWRIGNQFPDLHELALSPDGTKAAVAFGRNNCWMIDVATGQQTARIAFGGFIHHLCFSEDNQRLLLGADYGELILWDAGANREIARHRGPGNSVACQCLSSCGRYAVTFDWDDKEGGERDLAVWDLETGASIARLLLSERVTAIAMAGRHIALGDRWGRVTFLDFERMR